MENTSRFRKQIVLKPAATRTGQKDSRTMPMEVKRIALNYGINMAWSQSGTMMRALKVITSFVRDGENNKLWYYIVQKQSWKVAWV